jgi:hypothetical protein
MKVILIIPAGVAVILMMAYLVTRRGDEEEDRGILGTFLDLLSWW